eukprot:COSAG02_NODE_9297_length_2263_cov_5.790203_1_plen_131_part_00
MGSATICGCTTFWTGIQVCLLRLLLMLLMLLLLLLLLLVLVLLLPRARRAMCGVAPCGAPFVLLTTPAFAECSGGRTHLELSRGRDVTELFESYHALVDAPSTMMSKYLAEDQTDVPQMSFDWCVRACTL